MKDRFALASGWALLGYVVFLCAIGLGATLYWSDCVDRTGRIPPGDSLMAFEAITILGGLIWWTVWLGTAPLLGARAWRMSPGQLLPGLALLAGIWLWLGRASTVTPGLDKPGLFTALFLFLLPGFRGLLAGAAVARHEPFRRHPLGKVAPVLAGTVFGSTFLWWAPEIVTSVGALVNVRGTPADWPPGSLLLRLMAALLLCVVSFRYILAEQYVARQLDVEQVDAVSPKGGNCP